MAVKLFTHSLVVAAAAAAAAVAIVVVETRPPEWESGRSFFGGYIIIVSCMTLRLKEIRSELFSKSGKRREKLVKNALISSCMASVWGGGT